MIGTPSNDAKLQHTASQHSRSRPIRPHDKPQLSRTTAVYTFPMRADHDAKHACPCCRYLTLPEINAWEICPICFWEDDPVQREDPQSSGGANTVSLNQAQKNFADFRASEKRFAGSVRSPGEEDRRSTDTDSDIP